MKMKLIPVDQNKWDKAKEVVKANGYTFMPVITTMLNEILDVIGGDYDNMPKSKLDRTAKED